MIMWKERFTPMALSKNTNSILADIFNITSTGTSILNSIMGGKSASKGYKQAAKSAKEAGKFEAAQLTQRAGQSRATSQRVAQEEQHQANLAMSARVARAAGSGAGASDPTVVKGYGDLAKEGLYNVLAQLYSGKERANSDLDAASAALYNANSASAGYNMKAKAAKQAGISSAIGSLLSGGSTFLEKYGGTEDIAPINTYPTPHVARINN